MIDFSLSLLFDNHFWVLIVPFISHIIAKYRHQVFIDLVAAIIYIRFANKYELFSSQLDTEYIGLVVSSCMTFITAVTLFHQYTDLINKEDLFNNVIGNWREENPIIKNNKIANIFNSNSRVFFEEKKKDFFNKFNKDYSNIKKSSIKWAIINLSLGLIISIWSDEIWSLFILLYFLFTVYSVATCYENYQKGVDSIKNGLTKDVSSYFDQNWEKFYAEEIVKEQMNLDDKNF